MSSVLVPVLVSLVSMSVMVTMMAGSCGILIHMHREDALPHHICDVAVIESLVMMSPIISIHLQ